MGLSIWLDSFLANCFEAWADLPSDKPIRTLSMLEVLVSFLTSLMAELVGMVFRGWAILVNAKLRPVCFLP